MPDQWIFFSHAQVCEDINFLSCVMTRSVSKNVFLLNIFGAVEFRPALGTVLLSPDFVQIGFTMAGAASAQYSI